MDEQAKPFEVVHDRERKRFVIDLGDMQQAELNYQLVNDSYVYMHTGVPQAFRGRGLADQLAKAALDTAAAENRRVTPLCSFMQSYIRRHDEYASLVTER